MSESGLDVHPHLDRLLPCVGALLCCFDQVNQVTEDVYNLEVKLEEALARKRKKLSNNEISIREKPGCSSKPKELVGEEPENKEIRSRKIGVIHPKPRVSLPSSFLFTPSTLHCPTPPMSLFSRNRSRYSESDSIPFQRQASNSNLASEAVKLASGTFDLYPAGSLVLPRSPRRRAWHSGSSHSADAAQRSLLSQDGLTGVRKEMYALTSTKPWNEDEERRHMSDGVPVKRKAWTWWTNWVKLNDLQSLLSLCRNSDPFVFAYSNMTVCVYLFYFHSKSCNSGLMTTYRLSTVSIVGWMIEEICITALLKKKKVYTVFIMILVYSSNIKKEVQIASLGCIELLCQSTFK